jgi:hypothetical protein
MAEVLLEVANNLFASLAHDWAYYFLPLTESILSMRLFGRSQEVLLIPAFAKSG